LKAKIRGIYTTALTKLLLENGFEIVQPSIPIKERFRLKDCFDPPDIEIKDRYDLQGVRAIGTPESVDKLIQVLHSDLRDAITRKWHVSLDGIYKGKIVENLSEMVLVDIGVALGKLPVREKPEDCNEIIVQVQRRKIGVKTPLLTTKVKVIGKHAILTPEQIIGVSLKIRNLNERARLYALGKRLKPEKWGIIWRETSANQPAERLKGEINRLLEKAEKIAALSKQVTAPALLLEGFHCVDIEFPATSKTTLDQIRNAVVPTLAGHHYYKACGRRISAALEMAEKLLENGEPEAKVKEEFRRIIEPEYPEEGYKVQIEHVKLSGQVFLLGEAIIEEFKAPNIRFQRILKRDGIYDGLRVSKQAGDKAITEAEIGAWTFKTHYYSPDGEHKGTYINVNTPIELYPNTIRYVDLEVDVCVWPDKTYKILDKEKLNNALQKGWISERLASHVWKIVEEISRGLCEKKFGLKE
jgi:Ribonuclease G/E